MQRIAARAATNSIRGLIYLERPEPVAIKKHRRADMVVIGCKEEYERLAGRDVTLGKNVRDANFLPMGEQ